LVPEIFEKHHILYTGSSKNALKLEFDKSIAKDRIRDFGLKTALFFLAKPDQYNKKTLPLPFPLFVNHFMKGIHGG